MGEEFKKQHQQAFDAAVTHMRDTAQDPLQAFYDVLRVHVAAHAMEAANLVEQIQSAAPDGVMRDDPHFDQDFTRIYDAMDEMENLFVALGGTVPPTEKGANTLRDVTFEGAVQFSWIGLTGLVRDLAENDHGGFEAAIIALDMVQASAGAATRANAALTSIVNAMALREELADDAQKLRSAIDRVQADQVDARVAVHITDHLTRDLGSERMPEFPKAEMGFAMANVPAQAGQKKAGQHPAARLA